MKSYSIKEMKRGFFLGEFEPSAKKMKGIEIAVKERPEGTMEIGKICTKNSELIYIMEGKVAMDEGIFQKGDILTFEPGDLIRYLVLEELTYMLFRFPGIKEEYEKCTFSANEENHIIKLFYDIIKKNYTEPPCYANAEIDNKEITVVVQGYADERTRYTIESVRTHLPGAKLILSTWEHVDISGFDYDELVLSKDPGAVECGTLQKNLFNNGNRQIVSTKNGVERVNTKYTLRLRSDMLMLGDGIKRYVGYLDEMREKEYTLFDSRLLIGEIYTRDYYFIWKKRALLKKPFHPTDWFMFGLTSDVKQYCENIKLIPQNELGGYTCVHPEMVTESGYPYSWRYTTEQHIFLGTVRKHYPNLKFRDWTDVDEDAEYLSRKLLKNNFMILSLNHCQIINQKYPEICLSNNGFSYTMKDILKQEDFEYSILH